MSSTVDLLISRNPKFNSRPQSEDRALWQSLRKGNNLAFSNLYQRYSNLLFNYGMHICYNRELVKDCIQELFTNLWNKKESLSEVTSVKFYLFKSYRNLLILHINKDRKIFTDFNENQECEQSEPSIENTILASDFLKENEDRVSDALQKISKRQREILILKFFNDLSYSEIATIMGISSASTHNLMSKALQCMKSVMKIVLLTGFLHYFL